MKGWHRLALILVALLLLASASFLIQRYKGRWPDQDYSAIAGPAPNFNEQSAAPPTEEKTMVVYVSGGVNFPGTYELDFGSRWVDAVELAGGFSSEADSRAVNLAAFVNDGDQIDVPLQSDTRSQTSVSGSKTQKTPALGPVKVNVNKATKEQLMQLPGVGEKTAQQLLNRRKELKRFRTLEDLRLPGLGDVRLKNLEPWVAF